MLRYHLSADEKTIKAAGELSEWFALSDDGIETTIRTGDELKIVYADGKLELTVQKRSQIFYALKLFSDEYGDCLPREAVRTERTVFRDLVYMLDCSRNAVPLNGGVKKLIRYLAVMGYDTFMLYTEDTFVVKNQPYFGYLRTPFTKEDIHEIDGYCALFGIELVPCIQTLAHFNTLVRHYAMEDLFDCNDILLVGEERTYAFIEDLIATCAEYFTSRRIHIGMDEAHMLGRGKYMDRNGARSRYEIMSEHLSRVNEICSKYGFTHPMMWSDMFFSLANGHYGAELPREIAESVPQNVELVYWDYYSVDEEHYNGILQKHRVFSNRLCFAGGAWKWLGFTPDNRYTFATSEAAARACAKQGIDTYLVTGWGDNGAECSVYATLPGLLYYARLKYGKYERGEAFEKSFLTLTGVSFSDFMAIDLANRLTDSGDAKECNSANKYLLFNDVLLGTLDTVTVKGTGERYAAYARRLSEVKKRAGQWAYLFETQEKLCRVLAIKADIGIRLRESYQSGDKEALKAAYADLKKLPARIGAFYRALRAQWDRENRANGFDVQDIRIGALRQRVAVAIEKTGAYLNGAAPCVPELEEKLLCFLGHGEEFEKDFDQCEYRWRRMTSVNVND